MKLLAIDCAATLCAACVYDTAAESELGRQVLDLGKGHAEHLMAVIDAALKAAKTRYAGLDAIAVSVGPGSFTGLRVGVATARGLALALKIPAIGVTTLEALAAEAAASFPGRAVLAALDAGREEIHAAAFDKALVLTYGPVVATLAQATAIAVETSAVLAGTAAEEIAASGGRAFDIGPTGATADIAVYARLAAEKGAGEKPKPLYLRGADAKPQAGFILPRQDHDPKKWNPVFGQDHGPEGKKS
ncbi:tRNA (adenosine(37)-N6)-threonylcarbamoyltransferase complex dimerization subunit type 1 TsaB [Mesorhizobium sp. M4A.F.Ca.ET.022.05.2.1]|uniref:tRNA (adenosine(37)-N6)-threonylcarbamoyltransferase complex dimerization subunit type 1 TsaB n=1 Tax=unclassified Mesorhizobium TaxID=325217 RepID=UPI000FCB1A20|nr:MULTISPECIES: tRNA (adenosine(37)-N6)-threonylcarbamoyltransferase complex dimerization subunit type 1 TsaB [unclassified Mesorhizobium]RVC43752.1 tRNA (adenosine(37)-N6)-threonylcarbamoyltransferase complex dimerization subunit type 1 TsaB [Mesorhizobium sp. M4A.F.Ca.ET.090.04.2.1]RVC78634.1 tRNA (adenosine(37)-N6)-threonylcarbamoyltransferase complex dimerization subunit type 1 TsaB [Mesorhizobium sp. M4A.F.Ca.ET.022.05.2.1]RWD14768.1 MAG: tRNA (adenosine(37)-N6)-threonylcarbamoyltransferas